MYYIYPCIDVAYKKSHREDQIPSLMVYGNGCEIFWSSAVSAYSKRPTPGVGDSLWEALPRYLQYNCTSQTREDKSDKRVLGCSRQDSMIMSHVVRTSLCSWRHCMDSYTSPFRACSSCKTILPRYNFPSVKPLLQNGMTWPSLSQHDALKMGLPLCLNGLGYITSLGLVYGAPLLFLPSDGRTWL